MNDQRSQESSESRERRSIAVARSPNNRRNKIELAGRHHSHRPRKSLGITSGVPSCRPSSAVRSHNATRYQYQDAEEIVYEPSPWCWCWLNIISAVSAKLSSTVCVIFYLLYRYMRPEGPWQRLTAALTDSSGKFYIPISWPRTEFPIIARHPFLLFSRPVEQRRRVE